MKVSITTVNDRQTFRINTVSSETASAIAAAVKAEEALEAMSGASGTFTTADSKTVTVENGLITDIT